MERYDLLLVNPPFLLEKPDVGYGGGLLSHTELSDDIRVIAMNPGILSIASHMDMIGYDVKIFDLSADRSLDRLKSELKASQ